MKKRIGMIALTLLAGVTTLFAQPEKKSPEEKARLRVDKMAESLQLTDEQKEKAYEVMVQHTAAMQIEAEKMRRAADNFKQARRQLDDDMEKQMEAILDEEQMAKAKAHREERRERKLHSLMKEKHRLERDLDELRHE